MLDKAQRQADEARRLLQVGRVGRAIVVAVRRTGVMVDDNPQAEMDLRVTLAGLEPYVVTHLQVIARRAIDGFRPGADVQVRVDPRDPLKLLVA